MTKTLRMPLTLAPRGGLMTLTQGTEPEIAQSVALLLSTTPGERQMVTDYGTPNPLGAGIDVDEATVLVEEWEERATPGLVERLVAGMVEEARAYPNAADYTGATATGGPAPLRNGPRSTGDIALDTDGTPYIDDDLEGDDTLAVKLDVDRRPYVDERLEPPALTVDVDVDGTPFIPGA